MNLTVVQIADEARQDMESHALRDYPAECCGILVGMNQRVIRAVAAPNVAEHTRLHDRYSVDPLAILRTDKASREQGMEIIGFYHSHPDHPAMPSATDIELAWVGYVYVIVSVSRNDVKALHAWRLTEARRIEPMNILQA